MLGAWGCGGFKNPARGVAEVYQAQWIDTLNSAMANAFRQTLAEKPPDPPG